MADDADGPCIGEGGAMSKEPAVECGATATYTVLKLPLMLGSLPLTMLPFLLSLDAKQFGVTALGIGGLFAGAQGMMVLCRPVPGIVMMRPCDGMIERSEDARSQSTGVQHPLVVTAR
jgi:hypothetical protein